MTTLQLTRPIAAIAVARRQPAVAVCSPQGQRSWIERLAAWAERQPRHRHLGHWTAV